MLTIRIYADKSGAPPEVFPAYVTPAGDGTDDPLEALRVEGLEVAHPRAGQLKEPWPVDRMELVGDAPDEHGFPDWRVADLLERGLLSFEDLTARFSPGYERNPVITGSHIVLHFSSGDLRYEVLESPGRYPDDSPAGYRVTHEYVTRRA